MMRLATTPLSLSLLVSLDPEKTDLQLARDRIVPISAITIEEIARHSDTLVNPNVPISANSTAIHGLRASDLQGAQRCQPWWRQDYFLEGDNTENGRSRLKANLLLPITKTLQVLAISRGVTRTNSGDRAKSITQHHHMPIEIGQLGEDVAFVLRFYCVSKLPISPIVRHQPPPLTLAF